MASQYAIQDQNQFPALLAHSGTAGTAETRRIVSDNFGAVSVNAKLADSTSVDAFGRLKVTEPYALFDSMSDYGNNTFFWETKVNGSGTVTAVANNNSIQLSTGGTASGAYAYRATKQYLRYQPGRSLNIETTFVMGTAITNAKTRLGYFDENNGIFFERVDNTLNIVRRTFTSGTASEESVSQANWNVDTLDGNGDSGVTINVTKAQILFIQLQYLGVGRVQVGFVVDGVPIVAHQFLNTNNLSTVYMSTGCLPVRGEVINTDNASGVATLKMICTSVSSGGLGAEKVPFSASSGITAINTGTALLPIISIRAGTLYGGTGGGGSLANRGLIRPEGYNILVTGQITEYRLLLNATVTGGTYSPVNAMSITDVNTTGTAVTGGVLIDSGYLPAAAQQRASDTKALTSAIPLSYSGLNSTQDSLTLCARTVTGTGTGYASLDWTEEY